MGQEYGSVCETLPGIKVNWHLQGENTMAESLYLDKEIQPDELVLSVALGKHKLYWDEILRHVTEAYTVVSSEWKYYGVAWGWSFVIKSNPKTLCYLIPAEGQLYVATIFNDKGRALTSEIELPEQVKIAVEATKDNPKNIPYDFYVLEKGDVEIAKKLIAIRSKT